jgi:hypothetical protein
MGSSPMFCSFMDFAGNFRAAISLIQKNGYDLALVDLNLGEAGVRFGGEILYLLKTGYPDTRRIVVTGDPPSGSLRTNILDKSDVADFIIKTRASVPDLRRVVTEAWASEQLDGMVNKFASEIDGMESGR